MYKQFIIKVTKNAIKYKLFKTTILKRAKHIKVINIHPIIALNIKIDNDTILNNKDLFIPIYLLLFNNPF